MSNYTTGNPVPSTDPRDLDDNATVFDLLLQSPAASVPDRLGVQRKTWAQMEADAAALVAPNVAALAALTAASDKGVFFSSPSPVTMGTYTLTPFVRSLGAAIDGPTYRTAIGAIALTDTGAYNGSAAKLTTARNITLTGDGSWSVSFDGSSTVSGALTLNTVPVAKGGTGGTTASAARTGIGAAASGVNTDITSLESVSPAWTNATLQNSWTNAAGRRPAGYRKILDLIQLEVQITGGTATDGTTLLVLPAGFRPAFALVVPVSASPNTALSTTNAVPRVSIAADGTVACLNCTNSPGINFSIFFATV